MSCFSTAICVQVEEREKRLEKLGNCRGFPRAGNPLSAAATAREMAEHAPFTDSMMKMLSTVHECVCGGELAGPACPGHQGAWLAWDQRLRLDCPAPGRELCPCKPAFSPSKLAAPYELLPDFCPGLSGQEYRHPVLNKKRTGVLNRPPSKTEKSPFNEIYHIDFIVSINLQKGKKYAS